MNDTINSTYPPSTPPSITPTSVQTQTLSPTQLPSLNNTTTLSPTTVVDDTIQNNLGIVVLITMIVFILVVGFCTDAPKTFLNTIQHSNVIVSTTDHHSRIDINEDFEEDQEEEEEEEEDGDEPNYYSTSLTQKMSIG